MEAPPGVLREDQAGMVCKLLKALYGLKQAGHVWYKRMAKDFEQMGFTVLKSDQSVFVRNSDAGRVVVPVSTDDMVVAGTSKVAIESFKDELRRRYNITDVGEIKWLLGFEVKRDRAARTISINQTGYIEAMATKFGLVNARPVSTPMDVGIDLNAERVADSAGSADSTDIPYQEACGHVLWPAIISRPDIQFAVGLLACYTQGPTQTHWQALKRVINYLFTTRDLWLMLEGEISR